MSDMSVFLQNQPHPKVSSRDLFPGPIGVPAWCCRSMDPGNKCRDDSNIVGKGNAHV